MAGAVTASAIGDRAGAAADAVAWHELECGRYRADLGLWLRLAEAAGGPVLDVGAGSGRVALALARAGHEVVALDLDPALLEALAARAAKLPLRTVCADARELALEQRFGCCLVPMQTIQLLGGARGRARFLRRARLHLRPGGLLAAAVLPPELEQFDVEQGGAPAPDVMRRGGVRYVSRPAALRLERSAIVIERLRERHAGGVEPARSRDVIRLDRVTLAQLETEGRRAGFTPEPAAAIAETSEHVGSDVVMLRA